MIRMMDILNEGIKEKSVLDFIKNSIKNTKKEMLAIKSIVNLIERLGGILKNVDLRYSIDIDNYILQLFLEKRCYFERFV